MNELEVKIIGELSNDDLNADWKSSQEEILHNIEHFDFEVSFGPGTKGEHEALDRINIVLGQIDDLLLCHPTIVADQQLHRLINIASKFLMKVSNYMEEGVPDEQILKIRA